MIEKKIRNCYDYIRTSLAFSNYLNQEMYVTSFKLGEGTFYNLLLNPYEKYGKTIITHAILLLSLFKEETLKKDEADKLNLYINGKAFDELMGNLIQPDGTKYKLGSLTVDDKKEALEIIRNKLLHGDYYIENDTIYLCKEGITGEINVDDLLKTCLFLMQISKYKLVGENSRPMVLCKKETIEKEERLETDKDLKRLMQNAYFVEFFDEPEEGYERTIEYNKVLDRFYKAVSNRNDIIKKHTFKNAIDIIINEHKEELKRQHIKLRYEIKPVAQTTEYPQIKQFFISNNKHFDHMNTVEKRAFMVLSTMNILDNNNNDYLATSHAILNNIKALCAYTQMVHPELVEYNVRQSVTYPDDMTIAALFNAFYSIYHYGLDEIYSNGIASTPLREIASGKYLNFAKLKLDAYYDPAMTIEATFSDFPNQLISLQTAVDKAKTKRDNAVNSYNAYKIHSKTKSDEKTFKMLKQVSDAEEEYKTAQEIYKKAEEFMNNDFNEYVKNYNIISHMRNSFAHGNVRIKPYVTGDPLLDQEIVMQDIFKGNCTYSLRVKFIELHKLLEAPNAKIMLDFIASKLPQPVKKEEHTHKLS